METVTLKQDPTPPVAPGAKPPGPEVVLQPQRGTTTTVTVDKSKATQEPEKKADRPAWLPDGFDTPEQLAEAYKKNLTPKTPEPEKKPEEPQGEQKKPGELPKDAQQALDKAGLKMDRFRDEFMQKGTLSDESFADLEKAGLPRAMVGEYIEGQKAIASKYRGDLAQSVGGEEALQETLKWAETALTPAEIVAANKALASMDPAQAGLILTGLNTRRLAQVGQEPTLASGRAGSARGDVAGYESTQQWITDVNSKRYRTDPAFRAEVQRRVAASKF